MSLLFIALQQVVDLFPMSMPEAVWWVLRLQFLEYSTEPLLLHLQVYQLMQIRGLLMQITRISVFILLPIPIQPMVV